MSNDFGKNVKLIRLRYTPEVFICEVVGEDAETGAMKIQHANVMGLNQNGSIQLIPWMIFGDKEAVYTIPKNDILIVTEPAEALEKGYLESITSIALPSNVSQFPRKA